MVKRKRRESFFSLVATPSKKTKQEIKKIRMIQKREKKLTNEQIRKILTDRAKRTKEKREMRRGA